MPSFPRKTPQSARSVLEVAGLTRPGVFRDVSFSLRTGEILGLFGLVGAGRSEVARAIFGIDRADRARSGSAASPSHIDRPRPPCATGSVSCLRIATPKGWSSDFPISANITLPILPRLSRFGILDRGEGAQHWRPATPSSLQVKTPSVDQIAAALSGGNQQKVVLAKWLATDPKVLILDEPTRGIDIGSKAEVHRAISHLATQGLAILLISSELPEILGMADRVLVMHEGRLSGEFTRAEATQEQVMFAATGQRPLMPMPDLSSIAAGSADGRA